MEVSQESKRLAELVEQARSGLLTLPEFQRNFVWWRQSIESLLDSLLRGHYIGYLLFLEADKEHMSFGYRPMARLLPTSSDGAHPEDLALDGQQHIITLHYAFGASDRPLHDASHPYRFFFELESKHRKKILASHLIDADAWRMMEEDDYEAFLASRERAPISLIKERIS